MGRKKFFTALSTSCARTDPASTWVGVPSVPADVSAVGVACSLGVGSGSVDPVGAAEVGAAAVVAGGDSCAVELPSVPSGSSTRNATSPTSSAATRAAATQSPRPRPRRPSLPDVGGAGDAGGAGRGRADTAGAGGAAGGGGARG